MSYVTLGSRGPLTGVKDNSVLNPGNWTVSFTPDIINVNLSQFEVYKIVVLCTKPTLVTFDVYVDAFKWDTGVYGNRNSLGPKPTANSPPRSDTRVPLFQSGHRRIPADYYRMAQI